MLTRLALPILFIMTLLSVNFVLAQDEITLQYEDVLDVIAQSFDVSVVCLAEANDIDNFEPGDTLIIDESCPPYDSDDSDDTMSASDDAGQGGGVMTYTVVRGDRLAKIAEEYDLTVSCLQTVNNITNPDLIYVGQELTISEECEPDVGSGGGSSSQISNGQCENDRNPGRVVNAGMYTVQLGDMLDFIACDLDMSTACLITLNGLEDRREPLLIGQRLMIDSQCAGWQGPYMSALPR